MQLQNGTVVDRYTVEGLLGQGGMAVVYRVRHHQLGTVHALKVLMLPAKQIRDRLVQEGQVQARLRHPNIVAVTDLVTVDGAPGLVMEFVAGPSLDGWLRQADLTLDQADLLARGILEGVAAAHEAGLVHRDLKPGNVLLEVRKDALIPKITDFGLAKLVTDDGAAGSMTRSGLAMGTPCYMAPEQVRNAKGVDARADVFSLGAVLYELVTGRRAFDGEDTFEIFSAVAGGSYVPVRELVPDAPQRMVDAIEAALRTNRDERVQSVDELRELWVAGTPAPAATVAFQPATIARAQEIGSQGEDAPIGSGSPLPEVSLAPPAGGGSATMDWGISDDPAPSAPSIAPSSRPPAPVSQPSQAANRGPTLRRVAVAVGVFATMGFGLLLGIGVLGGGVFLVNAGAPTVTVSIDENGAGLPGNELLARDGPAERAAGGAAGDAEADAEAPSSDDVAVAEPARSEPGLGAAAPIAPKPAVAPTPAAPASGPAPAAAPVAADSTGDDSEVAAAEGDAEAGDDAPAAEAEDAPAPAVPQGSVDYKVRFHPITPGAEANARAWLIGKTGKYELSTSQRIAVPAGDYAVDAVWNEFKGAVRSGFITVPADGNATVTCYTSIKECR